MNPFRSTSLLSSLALALTLPSALAGGVPAAPMLRIDPSDRAELKGQVHPLVARARITGPVEGTLPMERMLLTLKAPAEAQARLTAFLARLQDPTSPDYHRWVTPEQFGERFGPSRADVEQVKGWLAAQGLRVDAVSPSRRTLTVSGDAAAVMNAFHTTMSRIEFEGRTYIANTTAPSIPNALQDLVGGFVSLHNIPRKAMNSGFKKLPAGELGAFPRRPSDPTYTSSSTGHHFLAPGDFATIYNLKPLYDQGIDGSGMVIAIAGRCDVNPNDVAGFREFFGLPADQLAITYNGRNPGITDSGEEGEADLDVQWSGGVAPKATVNFVVSASTSATDGVDLSNQLIVDSNLAPVVSVSFGSGEALIGTAECTFYDNLWAQAAAQGITVCVASGDAGAAGGDSGSASTGTGRAVNGLGSSTHNISVGGTQFSEGTGTYWNPTNGPDKSSAIGYIPEVVWNESGLASGGSGLWAGGGGISILWSKPTWQVAPGVPAGTFRAVPDVSLTAASHDGYIYAQQGSLGIVGGTSASSPAFAGIMALIVQKTGQRQGNANVPLYQLGNAQYGASGPAVFHDVTIGDNSVPGTTGFAAGTGYDAATGLGSVDAAALAANWPTPTGNTITASITAPATEVVSVLDGTTVTFTATATSSAPGTPLTYQWVFGDGSYATGSTVTHTFSTLGTGPRTCPVTLTVLDPTGVFAAATRRVSVKSYDMNGDGSVDLLDLFGWVVFNTNHNLNGDLNLDGVVDDRDLALVFSALNPQ
ncbi:MAG TPA: protease pro-enzyme activation domain-containing protein [Holophagaceae bacterium]|nr:protease pro-enzyme activation domain-containing protein [Holophagaceae bacterium]